MRLTLDRLQFNRFSRLRLSDLLSLARSRRALARLNAERLRDVGLDAETARKEAARPIWDAPASWKR